MSELTDSGVDSVTAAGDSTPDRPAAAPPEREKRKFSLGVDKYSGLYVWAALIVLFSYLEPNTFPTMLNVKIMAANQAITAILALALIFPIAAGVFDLSVAAILGFSLISVSYLMVKHDFSPLLAVVLVLIACFVIGAINAMLVVFAHVDSFITTLGMSSLLAATSYAISGGQQISGLPAGFLEYGTRTYFGVPASFVYMAVIAIVMWYLLSFTRTGRYLYAVGGNPQAARLAGVRVDRLTFGSLCASGTLAGVAGIILAMQLGSADISAGPPYLLPAFAAVFLGATQIRPGSVNVIGTLVAIFLLATGVIGLQLSGAPIWVEDFFNGAALILAVALATRSARRKGLGKYE